MAVRPCLVEYPTSTAPAGLVLHGGMCNMKLLKLPFMIVGFVAITAVTMTLMFVDWALRATFGEEW